KARVDGEYREHREQDARERRFAHLPLSERRLAHHLGACARTGRGTREPSTIPRSEKASPTSGEGTAGSFANHSTASQPANPLSADTIAPALLARFQKMPAARGTKAATSVTV